MNKPLNRTIFGFWDSPVTAKEIAAEIHLGDVQWSPDGKRLVWLERRAERGVLTSRESDRFALRDLTRDHPVVARLGYGGGEFGLTSQHVYYVSGGRIYEQAFAGGPPRPVIPSWGEPASPVPSPDGRWLLFVHSSENRDSLALVSLSTAQWPIQLSTQYDFFMQPCWHPGSEWMAWIAWDHPNMPWTGTVLQAGRLDRAHGRLAEIRRLDGDASGRIACFQPSFSPDGSHLACISDEGGWSNITIRKWPSGELIHCLEEEAEHALPAWGQGLRTFDWDPDGRSLYYLRSSDGYTSLNRFDLEQQRSRTIQGEAAAYTALQQISVSPSSELITLSASAPRIPPRIISVTPEGAVRIERHSGPELLQADYLSEPRPVKWEVPGTGGFCHALYYPPQHPDFTARENAPPAVVKIHGGPTSQYRAEFTLETQFFTSRGLAVLELNYRGSWGYGKAYRDLLKGQWGVADADDARSAASFLSAGGLADPDRLVIMGGSAGGFTVLRTLVEFPGLFRAAVCRYGVSNLLTLSAETHKFESHYLEDLIGPLPDVIDRYRERSPLLQADRIRDPLAVFQGERDQIVPQSQSDELVESLVRRGIPHLYKVFSGEGHGWRKRETILEYYRLVESFLRKHLFR